MKAAPRVVLDTNVLVSALLSPSGWGAQLRWAWQSAVVVPLASAATARELMRVLSYPKFKLSAADQHELLADFLPWAHVVEIPQPPPSVPRCRDVFDEPFLQLAVKGRAQWLVTGDLDLLSLAGAAGLRPVVSAREFCDRVLAGTGPD